jgi:UDP-N-acetylglucosamine 2-epimerase (non-hydrolysing)
VTGNTVVDTARRSLPRARNRDLHRFGVEPGRFVLATFHRPENVDDPARLAVIAGGLAALPVPVLLPVHPRTRDRAEQAGLTLGGGAVRAVDPVGYLDFLALEQACALIVSDSGGVQEEASIVGRPIVVARPSTERPEVLNTFATLVDTDGIAAAVIRVLDDLAATHAFLATCPTPFGDGRAGARIVEAIRALLAAGAPRTASTTRRYDADHGRDDGDSFDA